MIAEYSDDGDDPALADGTVRPDEVVSMAVLRVISTARDVPIEELPPLYDAVDPEALDAFFDAEPDGGTATFHYDGHSIVVSEDGAISVFERGTDQSQP